MNRLVITDSNAFEAQALDEDVFRVANSEIELILNYDSLYELALQLTTLIHNSSGEPAELSDSSSKEIAHLH